jgi:hypothetical protein
MKMKSLVVIALLVLGCSFASAQTFGFASAGGSYLYCNYEVLNHIAPTDLWQGNDILVLCGSKFNATIVGATADITASGNPYGFSVKGVAYADDIYDAFSESFTDTQWFVFTALKCAKLNNGHYAGKYGWVGLAAVSAEVFAGDYGYLSCQIPGQPGSPPYLGVSNAGALLSQHSRPNSKSPGGKQ